MAETPSSLAYILATPSDLIREGEALAISARGAEGQFVVGPSHAPFMTILSAGEIVISETGARFFYSVSGGFFEISEGRARILADSVQASEKVGENLQ